MRPEKKTSIFLSGLTSKPVGLLATLTLCGVVVAGGSLFKDKTESSARNDAEPTPTFSLRLKAEKDAHHHFDFVAVELTAGSSAVKNALRTSTHTFHFTVERDSQTIATVGQTERTRLRYDAGAGLWRGRWPVPWNAPDGTYQLRLSTAHLPVDTAGLEEGVFRVESRAFEPVPKGFAALTMEGMGSLSRFVGPDGGEPRATALADWADFIGADTLLIQGAESFGGAKKLPADFPWHSRPKGPVEALAQECQRRGIRLGVYILSFMVGGSTTTSPDYQYGWHYQRGQAIHGLDLPKRRGISIKDPKRVDDIVKILNHWAAVPGVDFLGLDYIRPVFGSQELVDDFISEMPEVHKPAGYDDWSDQQRMVWIGRGRYLAPTPAQRTEERFRTSDQWFWYRAHRNATMVKKIADAFGDKKPLWAFTLSWQKGWEHGQDPAMMRDAGVDMNGIMLYEADAAQYRGLLRQWNEYTKGRPFNLVPGNTFDWALHQQTLNPAGPEAMVQRLWAALERFEDGKISRGLFLHDLPRALRGRLGPYPPKEWMLAGGSAITRLREAHDLLPYRVEWSCPETLTAGVASTGTVTLTRGAVGGPVHADLYSSGDLTLSPTEVVLSSATPRAIVTLTWTPNDRSAVRGDRAFAAVRTTRSSQPGDRAQIRAAYLQGQRAAPPRSPAPATTRTE